MEILNCVAAAWQPRIGDPDVTGWLTVLAYLLCFVLAFQVWRRLGDRRGRLFWGLIALLMLFLAINKQMDLQSALTSLGRCMANAQGWYDSRRIVQLGFILVLLWGVGWLLLVLMRRMRGQLGRHGVALAGLAILCAFVVVRAVGFHHMDALIGSRQLGVSTNYLFENAGLVLIALNAVWLLRRG
ncbi:hypothetical protein JHW45_02080 [Paracoccus stylophorae]|uniref:Isopropylmalate isomerase n=1 Tax=Paracoccus stylophorae TaxID=659350 RepID=A0ABY7SWD0_9RHOB|nr:hypothetical protein [Paracoccus stylophorae]WCR11218.1 hypothetical protein JHW45_02080 [Paracoccus stylophorae]